MNLATGNRVERTRHLLGKLWQHLAPRRRHQLRWLLALMIVSAFAEVVSLGAVVPFLAVLTAPQRIFSYAIVRRLAPHFGLVSPEQLTLPLTVVFVGAILAAAAVRLLLIFWMETVSSGIGADLSTEVYRRTLYQPFAVHLSRNSSVVISGISAKIPAVVYELIVPFLICLSSCVLVFAMFIALLAISPGISLGAVGIFGTSYFLISRWTRGLLARNSQRIADDQTRTIKCLQEGLGGIRDVLLDGTQEFYSELYRGSVRSLFHSRGSNLFVGGSPRYIVEAMGMSVIALFAYGLSRRDTGVGTGIAVLGSLAFCAQRLLPALQQAYGAWSSITGAQSSLVDVLELLDQTVPRETSTASAPLAFQREIRFDKVTFRYSAEGPEVLKELDLVIRRGARIGFVGETGSGKSTTLDLLMGLLTPNSGEVLVDGQPIRDARRRAWQRTIAHVPQTIFLSDATLAENIAFGIRVEDIDHERVRFAAQRAHIASFIESQPAGYATVVGERGVRLSGGQRQRIGIARALYKDANVLVLDEATSALDNATEEAVITSIEGLDRSLTVLLIAHRLTTLAHCDYIIEIGGGRVIASGTYQELFEQSASFRRLAKSVA